VYKDEPDAYEQVYRPGKIYEPSGKEHERYTERFAIYKKLYPALKEINPLISDLID
jgi:sugar (pentulose or hexulose) kinase